MRGTVKWHRAYMRGLREENGPTGGVATGIPIRPHWFTTEKDNAGSMCDTCFGYADDFRHLYDMEQ